MAEDEDNAINRLVVVRTLELVGHSVVVAVNGQEALTALSQTVFDVVLMDVQMPVMDGFEATAVIRAQEIISGRHLPIVAMTAHTMKGDRERCLKAGMDGYVAKPIQEKDLFSVIESSIAGVRPPTAQGSALREEDDVTTSAEVLSVAGLLDNDQEFQRELAETFLEDCSKALSEIREAIASRNGPALMRAAHMLKNLSKVINDKNAIDAALQMEIVGQDVDWEHAEAASGELTREIIRVSAAMIDLTAVRSSPPTIEILPTAPGACPTLLPMVV